MSTFNKKVMANNFIGEYTGKLDAKGRIMFPAPFRKQLGEAGQEEFVINRGFEECLVLYPKKEWDAISKKINALNPFKAENRQFIRLFNNGATLITLDAAGRLLVPKELQKYAKIETDCYFTANGRKVELWGKQAYESTMKVSSDDFAKLAEKVMGEIDLNLESEND
jgi:MraZ protein